MRVKPQWYITKPLSAHSICNWFVPQKNWFELVQADFPHACPLGSINMYTAVSNSGTRGPLSTVLYSYAAFIQFPPT